MKDVGKNIRALRIRKGLTQEALAAALFVTRQTVSNYETGHSRPDIHMLLTIAAVLDTDVNDVLYGPPVPADRRRACREMAVGGAVLLVLASVAVILHGVTGKISRQNYLVEPACLVHVTADLALLLGLGWYLVRAVELLFDVKPRAKAWMRYARCAVVSLLGISALLLCPFVVWLVIRTLCPTAQNEFDAVFRAVPVYQEVLRAILWVCWKAPAVYCALGGLLCLLGFPGRAAAETGGKQKEKNA